jgi:DNA-binding protein H-NS
MVKKNDLEMMSIDDLWTLHERVGKVLSIRIAAEKRELEKRLAYLKGGSTAIAREAELATRSAVEAKPRRKYPRVLPKYRNPSSPSETWSGRGKQPRWLVAALKAGRKINDFKIETAGSSEAH